MHRDGAPCPTGHQAVGRVNEKTLMLSRVLIAEDNALVLLNLGLMLQDLGAQDIRTAKTAAEALAALDAMHFSLAVLDIRLGQDDGLAVADRCASQGIPVILSTGEGDVPRSAMAAMTVLLKKPYRAADLQGAIEQLRDRGPSGPATA